MRDFLESEIPDLPPERSLFHVIPAPMETSVSYGSGTANGPAAILEASYQLEAFDGTSSPCEQGILTTAPCADLDAIETAVRHAHAGGHFPILLGGEHTVTLGALRALKAAGETFGVVQIDAHADLRASYEGSALSHACVMRRALDDLDLPLFQIGVRALSLEEHQLRETRGVGHLDAATIASSGIPTPLLPNGFPAKVYITLDVDGLDPSLMPATGTPEPGGLGWYDALKVLAAVISTRQVIGADFVELAPIPGFHAPDFTVARLVYNTMGFISRAARP